MYRLHYLLYEQSVGNAINQYVRDGATAATRRRRPPSHRSLLTGNRAGAPARSTHSIATVTISLLNAMTTSHRCPPTTPTVLTAHCL